jgi:hypothetical protein
MASTRAALIYQHATKDRDQSIAKALGGLVREACNVSPDPAIRLPGESTGRAPCGTCVAAVSARGLWPMRGPACAQLALDRRAVARHGVVLQIMTPATSTPPATWAHVASVVCAQEHGRRVARVGRGHHLRVSLSPLSAIADMVAPVVIITLAAFLSNGLLTTATTIGGWVLPLDRERMGILRGPRGEMLDKDSVPPADRERLTQIRNDTLLIVRRIRHLRTAVLIIWIAIGLLVLSVAAIAAAATAHSEPFAFTALALVLAGVAAVFAGMATAIVPLARPGEAVINRPRSGASWEPGSEAPREP